MDKHDCRRVLIIVGVVTIIWGHWLAPRRLEKVRERSTPKGASRYDSFMGRPAVRRILGLPMIVGGVAIFVGILFLFL